MSIRQTPRTVLGSHCTGSLNPSDLFGARQIISPCIRVGCALIVCSKYLQGFVSRAWQGAVLFLAFLILLVSRLGQRNAQRNLPLYRQMEEYGIVSAAEESKVL